MISSKRFPAEALAILDALIADDRSQMPYNLGRALQVMAKAVPALRRAREWPIPGDVAQFILRAGALK